MPATPARIGFIQNEFRRAVSTTQQVKDRYGSLARESEDPIETFFDSEADAQVVADARQALLSVERRRFRVTCRDLSEILDISYSGAVPIARYVDRERDADRPVLVSEITFDLAREQVAMTLWG